MGGAGAAPLTVRLAEPRHEPGVFSVSTVPRALLVTSTDCRGDAGSWGRAKVASTFSGGSAGSLTGAGALAPRVCGGRTGSFLFACAAPVRATPATRPPVPACCSSPLTSPRGGPAHTSGCGHPAGGRAALLRPLPEEAPPPISQVAPPTDGQRLAHRGPRPPPDLDVHLAVPPPGRDGVGGALGGVLRLALGVI